MLCHRQGAVRCLLDAALDCGSGRYESATQQISNPWCASECRPRVSGSNLLASRLQDENYREFTPPLPTTVAKFSCGPGNPLVFDSESGYALSVRVSPFVPRTARSDHTLAIRTKCDCKAGA